MNPQHQNPKQNSRRAHAPYNFIPLPEQVVTVDDIPSQDRYSDQTGYIECVLTTQSPLYTRSVMSSESFGRWGNEEFHALPEEQQNERAKFFSLDDLERPVIPGSSLRGMVRTLVEIAGYGKLKWVTGDPLVFRAVGDMTSLGRLYRARMQPSAIRAGYMCRQGHDWRIYPAQPIRGMTFARVRVGQDTHQLERWHDCRNAWSAYIPSDDSETGFVISSVAARANADLQPAVLVKTGHMDKKEKDFVFGLPDENAEPITISDDIIRAYRDQITQGQESLLGKDGALEDMQPVFYLLEDDQIVFFGHAMMFRLPYHRSPCDLVPEPLCAETDTDLPEAIFGFVPESDADARQAHAGRVYFTDARLEPNQAQVWLSDTPFSPKILSGPKPTSFQHYLTQQEPDEVDTGRRDKRGRPIIELRLDHYASPPPHETVIRGHKLYWHRGQVDVQDIQEQDQSRIEEAPKQYTRIKPVRANVTFSFRIYFENLRDYELGALLWALTLPGEPGKHYCQTLGMGKPLGMGAVSIAPQLYLSDRRTPYQENTPNESGRYARLFNEETWHLAEKPELNTAPFVKAFEDQVLNGMDPTERGKAQSLKELGRIQMLFKMLEWPGPDPQLTEYMTIRPNKYRARPVLPDPLNAIGAQPTSHTELRPQPATGTPTAARTGIVKRFFDDKGYGFITQDDGTEIFVHHSCIVGAGYKSLQEGQQVTYSVGVGKNGRPQAQNVRTA